MKVFRSMLMMGMLIMAMSASAQMSQISISNDVHWYPGQVVLRDSSKVAYNAIRLPRYVDATLMASQDANHCNVVNYNPSDVAYIEFWSEDFPQNHFRLYSVNLNKTLPKGVAHYWGVVETRGRHGYIVMVSHSYDIDEDGELVEKVYTTNGARRSALPYVMLEGEKCYYSWPSTPQGMANLLDSDPVLSAKVLEDEDWEDEDLLNNYNPRVLALK